MKNLEGDGFDRGLLCRSYLLNVSQLVGHLAQLVRLLLQFILHGYVSAEALQDP